MGKQGLRSQRVHAAKMAQRTLALEAGAALDVFLEHHGVLRQGRCEGRTARSIERDQRPVQGRRYVHQPRIVGHDQSRQGEQIDGIIETGMPAQIARASIASSLDVRSGGRVFPEPRDHT